jgi:glyoxylase-like metal-dependent hydrolase (beta-lactamase superfamily II)
VTTLDDVTSVVLAPNPGPMTLEGTNTYLLGAPDSGAVIVVDPGPDDPRHRTSVEAALADRDAEVAAVVLTHHHVDHAEAAGWAANWGAPLRAFTPSLVPGEATPLRDGESVAGGGVSVEALHTPGHASDHLCLRVRQTGVVLTGDHVLGRGTSVVAWPDGDMGAYLASLERLARMPATALYPGHGPVLPDPARVLGEYIAHRHERERQVLDALAAGAATPAAIVRRVYADVDPVLHPPAERSVRAHLAKLVDEERVSERDGAYAIRKS